VFIIYYNEEEEVVPTAKMKVEFRLCNITSRSLIIAWLFERNKATAHI
jgi:hypothetical protein